MSSVMEIAMKEMGQLIELAKANLKVLPGPIVNASGYGAVGDGVTNDTAAVQNAIDYALANGMKAVFFPRGANGQYYVTALTNASQVVLFGDNAVFVGGYTGTISQLGNADSAETAQQFNERGINVKAAPYNAVGDGIADDTVAIQSAINQAVLDSLPLFIPQGQYKITQTLNISNLSVIEGVRSGDGSVLTSRFNHAFNGNLFELRTGSVFNMRDIALNSNGVFTGAAIDINIADVEQNGNLHKFRYVQINNFAQKGISVVCSRTTGMTNIGDVFIDNCFFYTIPTPLYVDRVRHLLVSNTMFWPAGVSSVTLQLGTLANLANNTNFLLNNCIVAGTVNVNATNFILSGGSIDTLVTGLGSTGLINGQVTTFTDNNTDPKNMKSLYTHQITAQKYYSKNAAGVIATVPFAANCAIIPFQAVIPTGQVFVDISFAELDVNSNIYAIIASAAGTNMQTVNHDAVNNTTIRVRIAAVIGADLQVRGIVIAKR